MGSTKLWLPSRKSVESHRGGLSIVLLGHWRFSSLRGGNLLYFCEGSLSLESKSLAFGLQDPEAQRVLHRHIDGRWGKSLEIFDVSMEQLLFLTIVVGSKNVLGIFEK
jgi:hypothetical protein